VISRDIARRYADALHGLAAEKNRVAELTAQFAEVLDELGAVADARRFLIHPLVPRERKMTFLDAAFPALDPNVRGLLGVVVDHGREDHLWLIAEELEVIRVAQAGVIRVNVETATDLDDTTRERLRAQLRKALGRPVELMEKVNRALLGGARIEVEGRVVDGTVSGRIDRLIERLEG